jgi:hypothetical protein
MFTPSITTTKNNNMKTTAKIYLIQLAKEIIVKDQIQDSILIQRELTNHIHKLKNTQDFADINLDAVQYLAKQGLSK